MINNVDDIDKVRHYAEKKIKKGIIDQYFIVDEYANTTLDFFNIDIQSFDGGYYYSIAELVGIYTCKTDYLIHFSSDTIADNSRSSLIREAIEILNERRDVLVANPTWDFNFLQAKEESFDSAGNFFLGYGFSDQCYLIRTDDFRKQIYNEKHPLLKDIPNTGASYLKSGWIVICGTITCFG